MMSNARLFARYERELDRMIAAAMPRTPAGGAAPIAVRIPVPVQPLTVTIGARVDAKGGLR